MQVFRRLVDGASWQEPRRSSTSSRHALPPTSRPPTRSCARAFAHSPGARRAIRCGWKSGGPRHRPAAAGAVSANVATLIFARTALRGSEIVVRHALGASRARVIAQIVTEGLVLGLAVAVLGLVGGPDDIALRLGRAVDHRGQAAISVDLTLSLPPLRMRCCSRSSPRH